MKSAKRMSRFVTVLAAIALARLVARSALLVGPRAATPVEAAAIDDQASDLGRPLLEPASEKNGVSGGWIVFGTGGKVRLTPNATHVRTGKPGLAFDYDVAPQQFTVGDMTFETNPAIEHWVNYYTTNGRRTMVIGIERSNAYLEMARAEFRNAGVPEDLVWLASVESVWNPRAQSPAAAGGIWQFIPATATDYGLKVEQGNDERADPLKQTRVAAAYLHDLYTIFGDWALAMAAYNSGEPRVMGAIVRNGNANFWELYDKQLLPRETCDYVPKILATIKLASQAEDYGFVPQAEAPGFSGS